MLVRRAEMFWYPPGIICVPVGVVVVEERDGEGEDGVVVSVGCCCGGSEGVVSCCEVDDGTTTV